MRGLVKWVWQRKIILAVASSVAGLVMTKRRQGKLAAEAPAPAYPSPPPIKPAAATAPAPKPAVAAPPAEVPAGAVPAGAVPAGPDGSAPSGEYVVKGKLRSKIFHTEASTNYTRTKADVWFKNAADAEAAGFRGAKELKRPGT